MKLRVRHGVVEPVSLFKFVFVGHALGLTMIFLPFFALFAVTAIFAPIEVETAEGGELALWLAPFLVPVVAILQALMIGGVVTLGLWFYTRRNKITVEEENGKPD